jgi:hypothetical protein
VLGRAFSPRPQPAGPAQWGKQPVGWPIPTGAWCGLTAHYRRTVAQSVWLAGGCPADEVIGEIVVEVWSVRRATREVA